MICTNNSYSHIMVFWSTDTNTKTEHARRHTELPCSTVHCVPLILLWYCKQNFSCQSALLRYTQSAQKYPYQTSFECFIHFRLTSNSRPKKSSSRVWWKYLNNWMIAGYDCFSTVDRVWMKRHRNDLNWGVKFKLRDRTKLVKNPPNLFHSKLL